jgi:putative peptide zinc metalloprotease protein
LGVVAVSQSFFSDKWYRVASLKLRLRPSTRIESQRIRGETWYILQDPQRRQLHRISSDANLILCMLDGKRTVEQAWQLAGQRLGSSQPSQDEIVRLLAHLHGADLLIGAIPIDIEELARRGDRARRRRLGAQLQSPLSIKIPIFNPNDFLARTIKFVAPVYSRWGFAIWLALVLMGLIIAILHSGELGADIVDRALAPSSLAMALLVFPVIKGLHELGHGWAVKRWGGEVHEFGVMLLVLFPVPYVDASDSGFFREKRRRVIVGAAGVMAELAATAVALAFWASAEDGAARALAFSVVLVGGLTTLVFNANPLIRLDGYYILSDLIEIPNLSQRASQYASYLAKRYCLGLRDAASPVTAAGERIWFVSYALASFLYRTVVTFAIALFLASKMFLFGVALAIWAVGGFLVRPIVRAAAYQLWSAELMERRMRAVVISALALAVVVACLFLIPLPFATTAEGVLWIPEGAVVRAETEGDISRVAVKSGQQVAPGEALMVLTNPELTAYLAVLEADLQEITLRLEAAEPTDRVAADMYREQLKHSQEALLTERERAAHLRVSAGLGGEFAAFDARDLPGRHVKRGDVLGYVLPKESPVIRVLVDQADVDLVRRRTEGITVRFLERPMETYPAVMKAEAPGAIGSLPSEVLGPVGGGGWVTDPADPDHRRLLRKAFQFDVVTNEAAPAEAIGGRVLVRFDHGAQTLAASMSRWIRQLFLRRLNV